MRTLDRISTFTPTGTGLRAEIEGGFTLRLDILDNALARVRVLPSAGPAVPVTWMITPGRGIGESTGLDPEHLLTPAEDVPWAGRDRADLSGFPCPAVTVEEIELGADRPAVTTTGRNATDEMAIFDRPRPGQHRIIVTSGDLRAMVQDIPLRICWQVRVDGGWTTITEDRRTGGYEVNPRTGRVAHYIMREPEDRYYGLGEKAGDLERTGRTFDMRCLDAMGYDAADTDPLYKHVPFIMTRRAGVGAVGVLYDNQTAAVFDMGRVKDNYHRPFISWTAEGGDIDYYVLLGARLADLTRAIVRLTGDNAFLPRWALGYSGSTMHYTDAPNASEKLLEFLDLLDEHRIPCDSFQMSSGYTSIGPKRYVFNWNHDKFPDPRATSAAYADRGLHLAANIKPALLVDHPLFDEAAGRDVFITDAESGEPELSLFWGDRGAQVDFTSPAGRDWWKENVRSKLLEMGIGSTWNDNNEYEVWDDRALCAGFGRPIPLALVRPVQGLLMMRASGEAQREFAPDERPYLISRSGMLGMQRYVQTWSGDNYASWRTLRYNTRMGTGFSMCGVFNVGHDVGGFSGPGRPDPELFVRWVQNGVMHPRFTIHSWHDDGSVNEPWMHPEVTPLVRGAIELRYRLMPYLYTALYLASQRREPIIAPTFYADESDESLFVENDDFLLGRDLLVASVVEEGATTRAVRLPDVPGGWFEYDTGVHHAGGRTVTVDAPLERLPLFVRAGAGIPQAELPAGDGIVTTASLAATRRRVVLYLPERVQDAEGFLFEDDGVSDAYRTGRGLWLRWRVEADAEQVRVRTERAGGFVPAWGEVEFVLRPGDDRRVVTV